VVSMSIETMDVILEQVYHEKICHPEGAFVATEGSLMQK
jgi:hypothetical protein